MTWLVLALAALPAFAQDGTVDGVITDALTKSPIAGATVKLVRSDKPVHSAVTDAQGQFRVAGVSPGEYRALIEHSGYLRPAFDHPAARPFAISSASLAVHLHAELVPLAQLAGRVLSPANQPLKDVAVGLRRLWDEQWIQTTHTGADGRFHFRNLDPGTWILAALPAFRMMSRDPMAKKQPLADPDSEEQTRLGWAATFFPSAVDYSAADRIVLRPGVMLDGYDVRLRAVPVRRVSGRVVGEDGKPAAGAALSLSDPSNKGANGSMKTADADGSFAFDAVKDGEWQLFAQVQQSGRRLKGYIDFSVSRRDAAGLEVRLQAPFPLTGFIDREQPRDADGKRKVTGVYLIPQGAPYDLQESAFHEQDGKITLRNVYAGRYRVLPVGYVPGYYVASIFYGDRDATTQPIDVVQPPFPLRVTYKSGAAVVTGTVERGQGAFVALVPQDESLRDAHQNVRTASCQSDGKFTIGSLRPGSYYAFAFDRVHSERFEDVDFVRRIVSYAKAFKVDHGETVTIDLRPNSWPDY